MKKWTALLMALMLTIAIFAGCGKKPASPQGGNDTPEPVTQNRVITAEEAKARIDSGDPVVIVDVRTPEEYAEKHIPGAILLPVETIGDRQPVLLPVQDAEILLYCRSGNRSADAAKKLADLGYTNLSDFGGINDWPYETEDGEWESKEGTLSSFYAADLYGVPYDEDLYEDHKLTMVNVWTTFCGYCLTEMPDLMKLSEEFADRGFQVVGVVGDTMNSRGEGDLGQIRLARKLAEETGASYSHLMLTPDLALALKDVQAFPTTFFLDEEGKTVGKAVVGARSYSDWKELIGSALEMVGA